MRSAEDGTITRCSENPCRMDRQGNAGLASRQCRCLPTCRRWHSHVRLRGRCQLQLACSSKSPVRSGGIGRGFARDAPTWHERRTRKLATLMLASLFAIGRTGMGLAKGQGASGLPLSDKTPSVPSIGLKSGASYDFLRPTISNIPPTCGSTASSTSRNIAKSSPVGRSMPPAFNSARFRSAYRPSAIGPLREASRDWGLDWAGGRVFGFRSATQRRLHRHLAWCSHHHAPLP